MQAIGVFAVLGLIYVLVRLGLGQDFGLSDANPLLFGYGALFAAGIVAAELLRPLLSMMSALSRFVTVAALAALVWIGLVSAWQAGRLPTALSDPEAVPDFHQVSISPAWDGAFRTVAQVNNRSLGAVVSTGTPLVLIQYEEAERLDLNPERLRFSQRLPLGDRKIAAAPVRLLSVQIDDVVVFGVQAAVARQGEIETSVIGLSFLDRLSAAALIDGRFILRQ